MERGYPVGLDDLHRKSYLGTETYVVSPAGPMPAVTIPEELQMATTPTHTADRPSGGISSMPFTALGGQPAWEPQALERFVAAARIATMSYVRRDGRPGQVPIWYVYRDGRFHLSMATGSPKHRALLRDPRVCVTIQDERPPYRAVVFDAVADLDDRPARIQTAGIEERYFGRIGGAAYRKMVEEAAGENDENDENGGSGQTEIELRPSNVRGFDNTRDLHPATVWFLHARPHLPVLRRWF